MRWEQTVDGENEAGADELKGVEEGLEEAQRATFEETHGEDVVVLLRAIES